MRAESPAVSAAALLALLSSVTELAPMEVGPGDLSVREAVLEGQRTVLVCFDAKVRNGSIGTREADQLVAAIRQAQARVAHLVFLLETSGIRVTDSTAGIASLRRVLRVAVDARLAGQRMLALVLQSTFGGASLLASLCERRVIHADALFSMSGPRLLAPFDASDRDVARGLLGGQGRAQVSTGFMLVEPSAHAFLRELQAWLRQPAQPLMLARQATHLEERLSQSLPQPTPVTSDALGLEAADVLKLLFPDGFILSRSGNVFLAQASSSTTRALLLANRDGATAADALTIARELLRSRSEGAHQQRCVLLLDAESHSSHPADEQLVLSEYLAHLALVTRSVALSGEAVDLVVVGHAGGGIQAALGSAASSVAMTPGARLFVLPRAALRAIGKAEDPEAGSLAVALAAQAVDHLFEPGKPVMNFYDLFARFVREDPAAACIATESGETLCRAWLDEASARCANALLALGCARGDRVAVQVDKSPHVLALYLGCLRAGLVFLPLNTAYQAAELRDLLDDARPRVFISGADKAVDDSQVPVHSFDTQGGGSFGTLAAGCSTNFQSGGFSGEEIAALLYTSGTTGKPKGAMLSHRAMVHSALALGQAWGFDSRDVLLHALPLFHGHGLFVSSNVALAAGACLLFQDRFDVAAAVRALPRVTVFMGVPTYYHRMLAQPELSPERCRGVRLFTCGSAPLSPELHRAFAQRTGHQIVERYGATETMILCSNPLVGERRPGSVGLPLSGVELRIADRGDRPVPAGEIGMIQVRGAGLFSGYWMKPEQTREELTADGYFRTGDLGRIDAAGYVSITGRSKDLIISGGYNVYPAEVESAIDEMPDVRECAVVGKPHPDFGEAVVAFVIPADAANPPSSKAVIGWARQRLANFKVPKEVVVLDDLPRNEMGKVLKNQLRATLLSNQQLPA